MHIDQQMEAAKALLKDQGQGQAEIDYFEAYANALLRRSLGLFTNNYSKLLAMAQEKGEPETDTRAAYHFSIKYRLDATDINIADLEAKLSYSQPFSETATEKQMIHPDNQAKLPLSDDDTELPEEPEGEPATAPAEAEHEEGPVV